jgi:hypothetical protein
MNVVKDAMKAPGRIKLGVSALILTLGAMLILQGLTLGLLLGLIPHGPVCGG